MQLDPHRIIAHRQRHGRTLRGESVILPLGGLESWRIKLDKDIDGQTAVNLIEHRTCLSTKRITTGQHMPADSIR
jgi:hypothetical protein